MNSAKWIWASGTRANGIKENGIRATGGLPQGSRQNAGENEDDEMAEL